VWSEPIGRGARMWPEISGIVTHRSPKQKWLRDHGYEPVEKDGPIQLLWIKKGE